MVAFVQQNDSEIEQILGPPPKLEISNHLIRLDVVMNRRSFCCTIQSTSSPSNQHVLLAASLCKASVDAKKNFKKSNSSKSKNILKMNELYCFCQKPDDGGMYIYCEGCRSWLHPKCAFGKNDLALTLTPEQWKTCNLLCNGSTTTIHNSKQTLYHSVCSLHERATSANSVGDIDYSIKVFNESVLSIPVHDKSMMDESVLSVPDHDQNIMDESVLSGPDHDKTIMDESILSVPEHDKTIMDESVTLGKNEPIVILKDIKTVRAESNHDSKQIAAPKTQNSKRPKVSNDFASVYQTSIQQPSVTSENVLTDSGKKENSKKIQRGLNWNTIQVLGNYNENVENKEKCRFTEIEVEKSFVITLDEWKKMIENRTEHHFKNSFYKDVILEKLRTLYSGCVPCISNHYLKKKRSFEAEKE